MSDDVSPQSPGSCSRSPTRRFPVTFVRPWLWLGLMSVVFAVPHLEAAEPRVSVVVSRSIEPYLEAYEGIRETLQPIGADIDLQDMQGNAGTAAKIAAEVMRRKPDVIVTVGTEASRLISEQTSEIPIVFSMVIRADALMAGGKSVGGASMELPVLEQLRVLPAILPNARRFGMVYNPALHTPEAIARWRDAAQTLGLELAVEPVGEAREIPQRLEILLPTIDALWLIPDETVLDPQTVRHIILETLRRRIPVFAPSLRFVQEGALVAVVCDYRDVGRQTGEFTAQLLAGRSGGRRACWKPARAGSTSICGLPRPWGSWCRPR